MNNTDMKIYSVHAEFEEADLDDTQTWYAVYGSQDAAVRGIARVVSESWWWEDGYAGDQPVPDLYRLCVFYQLKVQSFQAAGELVVVAPEYKSLFEKTYIISEHMVFND